jgi:hypothetical protein
LSKYVKKCTGSRLIDEKKIYRAMRLLDSSLNHETSEMLQNIEQGREILFEQANVALFSGIFID